MRRCKRRGSIGSSRIGSRSIERRDSRQLADFGGHHPDPNLTYAKALYDEMMSSAAPDFGA